MPDSCHHSTGSTSATTLTDHLTAVERGHYRPTIGTAGAVLAAAHPSKDRYTAERALGVFARIAYRREGLWWPMALGANEANLSDEESAYMAESWRLWCSGVNPFRGGRRVAA